VGYDLEGSLLEVCSCDVLCPCWIGEDPDRGDCLSVVAYHFDRGVIAGQDVSGLTMASAVHIPGNVLAGNWRRVLLVDDKATDEQHDAIVALAKGDLGGPMADLAGLVGEEVAVEKVPISHTITDGAGELRIGDDGSVVSADMHPYQGPDGTTTTLHDSIFSTVPGSPAYVGVAEHQKIDLPQHGLQWEFTKRNAIQSDWKLTFTG
jgi:hypothetical protein